MEEFDKMVQGLKKMLVNEINRLLVQYETLEPVVRIDNFAEYSVCDENEATDIVIHVNNLVIMHGETEVNLYDFCIDDLNFILGQISEMKRLK